MYSNETIQKFIALRSQSKSYTDIAQELGVAKNTLINWNKKFGSNLKHEAYERILDHNLSEVDTIETAQKNIAQIKIPLRQSIKYDLHEFSNIPLIQRIRLLITLTKEGNRLSDRARELLVQLPDLIDKCPGPIDEAVHPPIPEPEECEDDGKPLIAEERRALRDSLGLSPILHLANKMSSFGPEILDDLLEEDPSENDQHTDEATNASDELEQAADENDQTITEYFDDSADPSSPAEQTNQEPEEVTHGTNTSESTQFPLSPVNTSSAPVQKRSNFGPKTGPILDRSEPPLD